MAIRSYRDLRTWPLGMELARAEHATTAAWPPTELLGRELRRTSISIPSNIAEGYGRGGTKEYLRYLRIAMGSVAEMDTQLRLAAMMKLVSGRSLNRLLHAIPPPYPPSAECRVPSAEKKCPQAPRSNTGHRLALLPARS